MPDDGCMWVNMGDSYAGSKGNGYKQTLHDVNRTTGQQGNVDLRKANRRDDSGYKAKDLMMIPARVAMALQADGWYLRSQIPWVKRNSMPESVTDRPATAVEYVYLFSKSAKYFYDSEAVRVSGAEPDRIRKQERIGGANGHVVRHGEQGTVDGVSTSRAFRNSDLFFQSWQGLLHDEQDEPLALVVNPAGYSGAHFATFPTKLVEPMVKASTSERGCCATCGAPWARVVEYSGSTAREEMQTLGLTEVPNINAGRERFSGENPLLHPGSRQLRNRESVGWRPSCAHEGEPVPCTVLDPFGGSGTVGLVADRLGRNAILCELKPDYSDMADDFGVSAAAIHHVVKGDRWQA